MRRLFPLAILVSACVGLASSSLAQTFVEVRQDSTMYNLQSTNGMPISDTVGVPPGSDGRAPGANPGPLGTAKQFQGKLIFGGLVAPRSSGLNAGQSYAANADNLDLPRGKVGDTTHVIMLSARFGSPYLSRSVSYLFGATIPVPDVDEYGVLLKTANTTVTPNRPVSDPERYWLP